MKEAVSTHHDRHGERQHEALNRLTEAIAAIHDSDGFRRYLAVQARFHTYSWANAALIMAQRPDATRVAGFRKWQELGRQVRKGEHGIGILVPHFRKQQDPDGGDEVSKLTGFGVGRVFDIAQTDGEPLPEVPVPRLEGEQGRALWDDLRQIAEVDRIRVRTLLPSQMPSDETMGYYIPSKREIHVAEYGQRQMTKTLAHELAHHFHLSFEGEEATERAERETVAESVAFVAAAHYGLDTGERSFPYIAVWAQNQERFRAQLGVIQRLSARLIDAVDLVREVRGIRLPAPAPQAPASPPPDFENTVAGSAPRSLRAHRGRRAGWGRASS
jgi:antirestriction protein ArdC